MARLLALAFACLGLGALDGCGRDAETLPGPSVASRGCLACHAADKDMVLAPSFAAIAERYAGDKDAAAVLAESLKNGSHGKWAGFTAMPPQSQLSEAERKALVRSVLGR